MTMSSYAGPLHAEPLPIELHNTLFATRAGACDGLRGRRELRAWLDAIGPRLPIEPSAVDLARREQLVALRDHVREALHAALERRPIPAATLEALNAASAADPRSARLAQRGGARTAEVRHHGATQTDVLLGALAAETIELLSDAHARDLRICGAPGCVLMFLKDHPRRAWCSAACGNRTRQARHYARVRAAKA
jgi:predicted RNA-binding Zn ribbon-like protein